MRHPSALYVRRVTDALAAKHDAWGDALLRSRAGPSYDGAHRYLAPLLLAGGPRQRRLTRSGVYYLAFGEPAGAAGGGQVALHVADGSQIISGRVGGSSSTLWVGRERFGSCVARLQAPRLFGGYYPILETRYVAADGARFAQESFVARIPQTRSLVSFVRLTIARVPRTGETVRFTATASGLRLLGNRLVHGSDTYLFFSAGGRVTGASLVYSVRKAPTTIYVARLVRPESSAPLVLDAAAYLRARGQVVSFWDGQLARGASFVVPDGRVLAAERNLLIQNLLMTWRYSLGNPYEAFEFPESLENAAVIGEYGFDDVDRAIVETSLRREPHLYPNWEAASRLLAAGRYYALSTDRPFLESVTPILARNLRLLRRHLQGSGLLGLEKYTADLPDRAHGLPAQGVAWEGLTAIARAWSSGGHPALAALATATAARLHAGIAEAIGASAVRLPDGSLFIPARLLDDERPYDSVTDSKDGSYWNLVIQDALASGLFPPRGRAASGALTYLLDHGSRLLGLVRGGAYALYGRSAAPGASGTDEVYGLNVARFLADDDEPDQLVLSLYGALAAAMTDGTFVSGEGATVAPRRDEYYRAMYLPPNSTSNAAFLECLRLMLVHETRTADGRPDGLQLAYATPRAWLAPGRSIEVRDAPTAFGPLSYTIGSGHGSVRVRLTIPSRTRPRLLKLRLRLPAGEQITRVELPGQGAPGLDRSTGTIDLSGLGGRVTLIATVGARHAGER